MCLVEKVDKYKKNQLKEDHVNIQPIIEVRKRLENGQHVPVPCQPVTCMDVKSFVSGHKWSSGPKFSDAPLSISIITTEFISYFKNENDEYDAKYKRLRY